MGPRSRKVKVILSGLFLFLLSIKTRKNPYVLASFPYTALLKCFSLLLLFLIDFIQEAYPFPSLSNE